MVSGTFKQGGKQRSEPLTGTGAQGNCHTGATPNPCALGLTFRGHPGPHNAITDVPGVLVGHVHVTSP